MEGGTHRIEARGLSVDYLVQRHGSRSIKEYIVSLGLKRLLERKRIITGVDLSIRAGECFGIGDHVTLGHFIHRGRAARPRR